MEKLVIAIDVQNDFITGALRNEEAIKKLPNVVAYLNRAKANDIPVWFTRDTHHENYMETSEGKKLPVPHCIEGTDGWQIADDLQDMADETFVFNKPTFGSTALAESLAEVEDLKEVTLVGFCTDICVVSNALMIKAYRPEVTVRVVENCCAGVTVESHNAALKTMESCQIEVIR